MLELAGVAIITLILVTRYRRGRPLTPDWPIEQKRPFLAIALVSLGNAVVLNAALALEAAWRDAFVYDSTWDDVLKHLMSMGFILPMAFALSLRNLPLFMRLAFPPRRELTLILEAYVTGVVLTNLSGLLERLFRYGWGALGGGFGDVMVGAALLAFAAVIMVANGLSVNLSSPTLSSASPFFNTDISRHAITLGFITMLIFGMAVRMLPGFSGKTRVASTALVLVTFWLGNIATLFRVAPLFAPDLLVSKIALGSSGAIGWLAVACLAIKLYRTWEKD